MIRNISQHAFEDTLLDGVVIDIGEHERKFSTALAKMGCKVIGYEPGSIFDGEGNSILKHTPEYESGEMHKNRKLKERKYVDCHGINTVLSQHEKIAVLKIDIEGAEYEILLRADKEQLLKCQQITVEFHSSRGKNFEYELTKDDDQKVIDRLVEIGFKLVYASPDHLNTLFIRKGLEYSFDNLSIIVSVLNSHELVRRQLIHFNSIMDCDCELIMLDDGSKPGLKDITQSVTKNYDFTLIETKNYDKWTQPAARNRGAKKARYERLLFFDIDHILTREIIEYAKVSESDRMFFNRLPGVLDEYGAIEQRLGEASVHVNSFMIRKTLFNEVDGYDERLCGQYGHDDTDLSHRLEELNIKQVVRGIGFSLNQTGENDEGKLHDLKRVGRIGVYTALIGSRGQLWDQEFTDYDIRHNVYTNQKITHPKWNITTVMSKSKLDKENPARFAKQFKFHPEKYSKGELRIWIDANVVLTEKMSEIIEDEMTRCDLFFFKHYECDCAYDEAEIVKQMKLDDSAIVDAQMARYRGEGFPEHFGLPECNCIVSRKTPEVNAFFETWEKEVERGSVRDQLSVGYALWKTKPDYIISDKDSSDGTRDLEYRITRKHGSSNFDIHTDKIKLLILIPVHHPVDAFIPVILNLIFSLANNYALMIRPHTGGAYLHSKYNELLGGGGGIKDFDFKPYSDPDDEIYRIYDYIFTLENDMVVTGEQIEKLIAHDVDVVSGVYVASDGETFCHLIDDPKNPGHSIRTREMPVGLQTIRDIPLGGTLFKKGVFEQVEYPWFAPSVITNYDKDMTPIGMEFSGQDLALSHKLRDLGIDLWIDPDIRYGHVKSNIIYPGDNARKYNVGLDDAYELIRKRAPVSAEKILTLRRPT